MRTANSSFTIQSISSFPLHHCHPEWRKIAQDDCQTGSRAHPVTTTRGSGMSERPGHRLPNAIRVGNKFGATAPLFLPGEWYGTTRHGLPVHQPPTLLPSHWRNISHADTAGSADWQRHLSAAPSHEKVRPLTYPLLSAPLESETGRVGY